jgi:hypothetical protein
MIIMTKDNFVLHERNKRIISLINKGNKLL